MIKALSPYWIEIPLVNPNTSNICTSFRISIYAWNGLINSVPSSPVYESTVLNPTASTGNKKIDVSKLIADFIDFTQQEGTTTSVIDGNNQNWLQYRLTYSDTLTEEIIDTIPYILGYSYGMDGENQSTPANKILLSGNEFKVSRDSKFVLTIETDIGSVQIIAEVVIVSICY